ncbi:hypothetical protein [Cytophaga aurantiaca]|uniref:hypothetical protein n=1 Tax=Cytophaga aurantiaca TaxID=29530 RepID=UPI000379A750|nr:hypothetical protein [Cytophaga aurantiaca]
MKYIYSILCFFLISSFANAQIDYSYFKQTWCKCLPDNDTVATDTLTFRIESETCKTERYIEKRAYIEELEYTFEKNNGVGVVEGSGNGLRGDEVPERKWKITFKYYAIGDTIGRDSTYEKIEPAHSNFRGEAKTILGHGKYQLNKSKNTLTIIYDEKTNQYEILFLSSKMMLLRKINE